MTQLEYVDLIISLARQVELGDPIDWDVASINEDDSYRLIALSVVEQVLPKYNDPDFRDIVIATIVKLVVENFILNLRLRKG